MNEKRLQRWIITISLGLVGLCAATCLGVYGCGAINTRMQIRDRERRAVEEQEAFDRLSDEEKLDKLRMRRAYEKDAGEWMKLDKQINDLEKKSEPPKGR